MKKFLTLISILALLLNGCSGGGGGGGGGDAQDASNLGANPSASRTFDVVNEGDERVTDYKFSLAPGKTVSIILTNCDLDYALGLYEMTDATTYSLIASSDNPINVDENIVYTSTSGGNYLFRVQINPASAANGTTYNGDFVILSFAGNYFGTYSGTFTGGYNGFWQAEIATDGTISGTVNSVQTGLFNISGQLGADGSLNMAGSVNGGNGSATFTGQIDANNNMTGTWRSELTSGSFSGTQTVAVPGGGGTATDVDGAGNDSPEQASTILNGQAVSGHIDSGTDGVDWWSFDLAATDQYDVTLSGLSCDVDLFHYEESDTSNWVTDSALGGSSTEQLTFSGNYNTRVYFKVDPYQTCSSDYTLSVSGQNLNTDVEPNEGTGNANEITLNTAVQGNVDSNSDPGDGWVVRMYASEQYQIQLSNLSCDVDLYLIFDDSLQSESETFGTANEVINFTATTDGLFYPFVSMYDSNCNSDYTLTVTSN